MLVCWWLSLRLGLVLLSLWLSGFGFFSFSLAPVSGDVPRNVHFRLVAAGVTFQLLQREGRRARRMGTDPSTGFFRYSPFTLYFLTQCPRQRTSAAVVRYVLAEGLFYNVCWWPSLLSSPFQRPPVLCERAKCSLCFLLLHRARRGRHDRCAAPVSSWRAHCRVLARLMIRVSLVPSMSEFQRVRLWLPLFLESTSLFLQHASLSRTLNVGISTGTAMASITSEIAFRHLCFLNAYFSTSALCTS